MATPNPPRPYLIAESNWKTVQETHYDLAVLPWGATEAHNYHLPYATDNLQNEAILAEAGRLAWQDGAKVAILPNIPFGSQGGQTDIPFCVNLDPSTQAKILKDIVLSLSRNGLRKIVVFNGHGGNCFKQILREFQGRYPDLFLSQIHWFSSLPGDGYFDAPGDHADERETSLMLAIAPHLVRPLQEAGDGRGRPLKLQAHREGQAWAPRAWSRATVDTGSGDPSAATAAKGHRYLADLARRVADYFVELAAADLDHLYEGE
jgi:creatinine amidohydrolase